MEMIPLQYTLNGGNKTLRIKINQVKTLIIQTNSQKNIKKSLKFNPIKKSLNIIKKFIIVIARINQKEIYLNKKKNMQFPQNQKRFYLLMPNLK